MDETAETDVVDCHAHIFPPLWQACGLPDAETHLLFQQRAMHTHLNQPVRRLRDHAIVEARHLWDVTDPSEAGRATDVDFRVGRMGRFEWTVDDEDYYVPCVIHTWLKKSCTLVPPVGRFQRETL